MIKKTMIRTAITTVLIMMIFQFCKEHKHNHPPGKANEYMHSAKFEKLVQRFESKDRDKWQKPEAVIKQLAIKPGMTVGDIGAGTGYFTRRFARAVGKEGQVIGLDVDSRFIDLLKKDAERLKLPRYKNLLIGYKGEKIDQYEYDLLFLCNVYHHIEDRGDYFKKLKAALKPGGRLVIIDFKKEETPVGPPLDHKMAKSRVLQELATAGYKLTREDSILPWQYMLTFQPE